MVDINELYITPDNKRMIIDVSVKDDVYHKDAYITEVVLDTQDTFVPDINQPSDEWIAKRPIDSGDYVAKIAWETRKVDEYLDIVCSCNHMFIDNGCHCHHSHHIHNPHHGHCGCGHHKDVCKHRTGGTGHYANPYEVVTVDLTNGTAMDQYGRIINLVEGDFLKFIQHTIVGAETSNSSEGTNSDNNDNNVETNVNTGSDDSTIYEFKNSELVAVPDVVDRTKIKHARLEIRQEDVCRPFEDTMFFVWVKCVGVDPELPCAMNSEYTLGVCVNYFNIYRRFICLMRELLKDCEIPKSFIDLYMRWKAVKMAISTGNYLEAVLLWKRFFLFQHQRPLWESPQYERFWADWHKDELLPFANYPHPTYGFGGSLFNFMGGHCRTCGR